MEVKIHLPFLLPCGVNRLKNGWFFFVFHEERNQSQKWKYARMAAMYLFMQ